MRARVEDDAQGKRLVYEACFEPCAIEKGMRIIGGKWTGVDPVAPQGWSGQVQRSGSDGGWRIQKDDHRTSAPIGNAGTGTARGHGYNPSVCSLRDHRVRAQCVGVPR